MAHPNISSLLDRNYFHTLDKVKNAVLLYMYISQTEELYLVCSLNTFNDF